MKTFFLIFALCLLSTNAFAIGTSGTTPSSDRPNIIVPDESKWDLIKDLGDKKLSFCGNTALYKTDSLAVDATAKLDLPSEEDTSRLNHYGLTISVTFAL